MVETIRTYLKNDDNCLRSRSGGVRTIHLQFPDDDEIFQLTVPDDSPIALSYKHSNDPLLLGRLLLQTWGCRVAWVIPEMVEELFDGDEPTISSASDINGQF